MYSFIYYYFFRLIVKRNPSAKFGAASIVIFTHVVHICLLLSIIKKIYSLSYSNFRFSDIYLINKLYMMPFAFVLLFLGHYYYNKRFEKIKKKYAGRKMLTLGNAIIVFSIMLIPLIIMIQLLKK